jgi:hypothetical protein
MNSLPLNGSADFGAELEPVAQSIRNLAQNSQGNSLALLGLLRALEALHQEIRDGLFQEALPDNRQALYSLLRDIELSGGWPYIQRMRLQSLLKQFDLNSEIDAASLLAVICASEETSPLNQDRQ